MFFGGNVSEVATLNPCWFLPLSNPKRLVPAIELR